MKKTEKQKMLDGEYYDASITELVLARDHARNMSFDFNNTHPSDRNTRRSIIKKLINIKEPFDIESDFNCDYGFNIEIGKNFFANFGCTLLDTNKIIIGDNVLLAPHVQMYTAAHPTDPNQRLEGVEYAKPIVIKDNVWIGGGAIICPGVTIGNNVTIGAGSVVTKDIADNTIAVGNPCKVIKEI